MLNHGHYDEQQWLMEKRKHMLEFKNRKEESDDDENMYCCVLEPKKDEEE